MSHLLASFKAYATTFCQGEVRSECQLLLSVTGTFPFPDLQMLHCLLWVWFKKTEWFKKKGGEESLVYFACPSLLSYHHLSNNSPGVLTILPSGESKLWPGSKPAGDTCWRTAWLVVTMAVLPWWLIVDEEVTSLFPGWL